MNGILTHRSNLKYSSKRNPCPICQKDHGCRISDSLILCLRGDRNTNTPGWIYRKDLKSGMGSVFVRVEGEESTFDREAWRQKQAQLKEAERKRSANSLSEEQRDRNARKILKQIGLATRHRENLKNRGLSDAQIEEIGFKSVERGQRLIIPISPNFPAANHLGSRLRNVSGYLVPLFNEHQQIIGFQIAADDRSRAKYPWLSEDKDFRLPNEEPPLTIRSVSGAECTPACDLESNSRSVRGCREAWLAEGTLKPLIASMRLNKSFIGASGGHFTSSSILLKRYLNFLNPERVIIPPDAGIGTNKHVQGQVLETIQLVESWGYEVVIAWWGQFEKTPNNDIDEIDPSTEIQYLTPDEFLSVIGLERPKTWLEEIEIRNRNEWRKTKQFTPTETQDNKYVVFDLPPIGSSLIVKSGLGTGKTHQLEKAVEKAVNLGEGIIILGSRNSLQMELCERFKIDGKLTVKHLHRHKAPEELQKPDGRVALCTNSINHFLDPNWFNGKVVIIDEIKSVIDHILRSKTHRKNRRKSIELFVECLKRASRRIFCDGHSADWIVEYLQGYLGVNHPFIKLENLQTPERQHIKFLVGCVAPGLIKLREGVNTNDYSSLLQAIYSGQRFGVICDSQRQLKAMEKTLTELGKSVIRIDSETVADKNHPAFEFISGADKWIHSNQPDAVLISPTFAEGGDISIRGYFQNVYALFHGVLAVDALRQFLGRFRDPDIQFHVWCKEFGFKNGLHNAPWAQGVLKHLEQFLCDDAWGISNGNRDYERDFLSLLNGMKDDPHYQAWAQLQATENYEKSNLRDCLKEALLKDGYELKEVYAEADGYSKKVDRAAKKAVAQQLAEDIFNAEDIDSMKAEELASNWACNYQDRCQVRRRALLDRLPGVEDSPLFSSEFVLEMLIKDRKTLSQIETYYLYHNPDDAKDKQQNIWAGMALRGNMFLPDIRSRHQTIQALKYLEVDKYIERSHEGARFKAEDFKELVRLGKHKRVRTALGFRPGSDNIKYAQKVFNLIGCKLGDVQRSRKDGHIRTYRILTPTCIPMKPKANSALIAEFSKLAYECIENRYREQAARDSVYVSDWEAYIKKMEECETENASREVVAPLEISEGKNRGSEEAESTAPPDFEGVPEEQSLFNNLGDKWCYEDADSEPTPEPDDMEDTPTPDEQEQIDDAIDCLQIYWGENDLDSALSTLRLYEDKGLAHLFNVIVEKARGIERDFFGWVFRCVEEICPSF